MKTSRTGLKPALLAIATALVAMALPASASAVSGGLAPAGQTLSFGSKQVTIGVAGGNVTCTMNGGTVNIPASPNNRNATGPFIVNFATRPTFTACTNLGAPFNFPVAITTSGTWQLKVTYGGTTSPVQIGIPPQGISVSIANGLCTGFTSTFHPLPVIAGNWTNGISTDSTVVFQPGTMLAYGGGSACMGQAFRDLLPVATPTFITNQATPGNITIIP